MAENEHHPNTEPSMHPDFKKSPIGLSYTAGLDAATATHLQTVAWDTVQDYFKP